MGEVRNRCRTLEGNPERKSCHHMLDVVVEFVLCHAFLQHKSALYCSRSPTTCIKYHPVYSIWTQFCETPDVLSYVYPRFVDVSYEVKMNALQECAGHVHLSVSYLVLINLLAPELFFFNFSTLCI
jgi:hypothetical protein